MAISSVFGTYADKREAQATAATEPFHDHSGPEETWVDYVSDLGDGFNATYTLAYLLAQPKLDVTVHDGQDTVPTTRGSVLVMGGDEVYPSASSRAYEERTKGPYNAALPHADDPPALFAIPGNHDWYDGLTAFLRFFCQGGWVGGWKTEQRRSYFAVKLPQRWWLLGIDIQFDTYIDAPQIEYFRNVAARDPGRRRHHPVQRQAELGRGRQAGVEGVRHPRLLHHRGAGQEAGPGAADAGRRPAPLRALHRALVAGQADGERALITCGGGGAYLSATRLDKDGAGRCRRARCNADIVDAPPAVAFSWRAAYPTPEESRRLALRVFYRLPGRNPWFVALMAAVQALVAYALVTSLLRRADGSPIAGAVLGRPDAARGRCCEAFREPRAVRGGAGAGRRDGAVLETAAGRAGSPAGLLHGLGHLASAVRGDARRRGRRRAVRLAGRGAGHRPARRRGAWSAACSRRWWSPRSCTSPAGCSTCT